MWERTRIGTWDDTGMVAEGGMEMLQQLKPGMGTEIITQTAHSSVYEGM